VRQPLNAEEDASDLSETASDLLKRWWAILGSNQ